MNNRIGILDYIVLLLILSISALIGIYYGFRVQLKKLFKRDLNRVDRSMTEMNRLSITNKHNEDTSFSIEKTKVNEYLTANSSMGTISVAFSLLASFFSATSILGIPAEIYTYGIQYWISSFGLCLTPIMGAYATGPLFAKLKCLSVFEYLEMRFESKNVRLVRMVCYVVKTFIGTAIFMYGPATALSAFTDLNDITCILIIGIVGTFYTTIGGIKAVIWTDLFQGIIMISSLLLIAVKGTYDVGGLSNLIEINYENGRLNFFDFNPDPFIRQSFWSLCFGMFFYFCLPYCFDQQMIQRFTASKTKKTAQKALLLNAPGSFLLMSLCSFTGLIVYAYFSKCDPLTSPVDKISNPNQLIGHFVIKSLGSYPGAVGLFLGSVFCGSLSSVSSVLNSLSATIWQDFLKLFSYFRSFSDNESVSTTKMLAFLCGTISSGMAILISTLGGNIVQINYSLNGAFNAPIIGLFLLGCLFRFTNAIGAITGTIFGFIVGLWLSFGAYLVKPNFPKLNVSIELCNNTNLTYNYYYSSSSSLSYRTQFDFDMLKSNLGSAKNVDGFNKFYSLSYMWFTTFGVLITVLVGVLVSVLTGGCKEKSSRYFTLF